MRSEAFQKPKTLAKPVMTHFKNKYSPKIPRSSLGNAFLRRVGGGNRNQSTPFACLLVCFLPRSIPRSLDPSIPRSLDPPTPRSLDPSINPSYQYRWGARESISKAAERDLSARLLKCVMTSYEPVWDFKKCEKKMTFWPLHPRGVPLLQMALK